MTLFKGTVGGHQDAGDQWTSAVHFEGALTLAAAATAWETHLQVAIDALAVYWATTTHVDGGSMYTLDGTTGRATGVLFIDVGTDGTAAGAQLPPRDAIVVGTRTALPGPGGRGRMFWPAPATDSLTDTGLVATIVKNDFSAFIATLLGAMATDGLTPVLVGPVIGGLITTPIIGTSVAQVLGSQRRRTNKIAPSYSRTAI